MREHGITVEFSPWVVHDLRRTLTTGCQKLGIDAVVTEAILNHISGILSGVAGTYHLYKYSKEKAAGLRKWADKVDRIVKGHRKSLQ
jgi:metal-dependent hydrolase (beta-lactamase superfamily II)